MASGFPALLESPQGLLSLGNGLLVDPEHGTGEPYEGYEAASSQAAHKWVWQPCGSHLAIYIEYILDAWEYVYHWLLALAT
mmetsp:Transcript_62702/g.109562  ORF Transcript_62702/g.109562 Transcript_62702/m.109562 type:complete len:81 (+) Transcript_62702:346-588(+)